MNYSQVGIANVALQRIGARGTISSLTENSPNAIKVNTCWDYVFQEVMSERDWKFAKTRAQLQQNANHPVGGYLYAYALPADFLRLCKPREIPEERRIANFAWVGSNPGWDQAFGEQFDIPVWPRWVAPYVTETVQDGTTGTYTTNLLSNYPGLNMPYVNAIPVTITYIRLITDFTQLLPGFVNCLTNRLAAELAIAITEDSKKAQGFMEMYQITLNSAQAQQECDDYLKDESGNFNWVEAGRFRRGCGR
jgi:hypothetical protein